MPIIIDWTNHFLYEHDELKTCTVNERPYQCRFSSNRNHLLSDDPMVSINNGNCKCQRVIVPFHILDRSIIDITVFLSTKLRQDLLLVIILSSFKYGDLRVVFSLSVLSHGR